MIMKRGPSLRRTSLLLSGEWGGTSSANCYLSRLAASVSTDRLILLAYVSALAAPVTTQRAFSAESTKVVEMGVRIAGFWQDGDTFSDASGSHMKRRASLSSTRQVYRPKGVDLDCSNSGNP